MVKLGKISRFLPDIPGSAYLCESPRSFGGLTIGFRRVTIKVSDQGESLTQKGWYEAPGKGVQAVRRPYRAFL
jgi:hypothetical protein